MKKRIISILMVAVMLVGLLPAVALAADEFTISLSDEEATIAEGASVATATVVVSLANNPGIAAAQYTVKYDTEALKLTGITNSNDFNQTVIFVPNAASNMFGWTSIMGNVTANGEAFYLTFEVQEGALNGEYSVELVETKLTDSKTTPVTAAYEAGSVTVTTGVDITPVLDSTNPADAEYDYGEEVAPLSVVITNQIASDVDGLAYQWYKNGEKIDGAASAEYTPAVIYAATEYYCVVTNTYKGVTCDPVQSRTATVTFHKATREMWPNMDTFFSYGETNLQEGLEIFDKDDNLITENLTFVFEQNGEAVYTCDYAGMANVKLNVGTYQVKVTWAGDENYEACTKYMPDDLTVTVAETEIFFKNFTAPYVLTLVKGQSVDLEAYVTGVYPEELVNAELWYESSDESVATVDENGKVTAGDAAGEDATITVHFEGEGNYNGTLECVLIKVTDKLPATVTFAASTTEKPYDPNGYTLGNFLTTPATTDPAVSEVVYVFDGNEYTWDELLAVSVKNAGDYVITAKVSDATYAGEASVTVKITAIDPTADLLNYDLSSVGYDGNEHAVTVTAKEGVEGLGGITVKYNGSTEPPVNAGTYEITVEIAAGTNYNAKTLTLGSFTIETVQVAVPTAETGLTYTGSEQTGVADGEHFSVENGSNINAGDYIATVTLDDTTNYEWADSSFTGTVSWSIGQASAQALTNEVTLQYNSTASQDIAQLILAKLPGAELELEITSASSVSDLVVVSGTTFALAEGLAEQEATATVNVTFTSNNYAESTLTITVNIIKKVDVSDHIVFEDGSAVYNGEKQTYENAAMDSDAYTGEITYTYSADPVNVGTYSVTAVYDDDTNHGERTVTFTITPAELTITGATVVEKEYDGNTDATVTEVTFRNLQGSDVLALGTDYTATGVFADAAIGTHNVTVTVTLTNSNYTLKSNTVTAQGKITQVKAEVEVALEYDTHVYTGSALTPSVTVTMQGTGETLTDHKVTYTNNKDAGTASVTVEATSTSGYYYKVEKTFTITPATLGVSANALTVYWTGKELEDSAITGTVKFNGEFERSGGEWTWVEKPASTNVGEYTGKVKFTSKSGNFEPAECEISVTIKQATPNVTIKTSGVKAGDLLIDVTVENGKLTVTATLNGETIEGTLTWDDAVADAETQVKRGKSYAWTFTPDEKYGENVAVVTGKTTLVRSSTGGGGGSYTPSEPIYDDVAEDDWFYDEVEYVTEKGLMNGTGDGSTFSPYLEVSRAMLVVTLWRMEGSPVVDYDMSFTDVADGQWYTEAIRWAASKGVVTGYGGTTLFGTNDAVTREQMATILCRYADQKAVVGDHLSKYPDGAETSDWAKDGVNWAVYVGLLSGDNNGHLNPTDTASRAELATILMRYDQTIG